MKKQISREEFIGGKTSIEDPILEPYFLLIDDNQFHVCIETVSKGDHHFSKGKPKTYIETLAYITKLDLALKYVLKFKNGLRQKKNYNSISEYLTQYKAMYNDMKKITQLV
jgi:Ni2+-binding GTPase involved in maturation of urease and hydrogenase